MKIRTDFVTNSSSSSFTIINFDSPLLEAWIQKNPIRYGKAEPRDISSPEELFSSITDTIDVFERCVELVGNEGIVDNLLHILGSGEGEDELDSSFAPLVEFLENNREALEAEGSGEIVYASQLDMEAPTIDVIRHKDGQSSHAFLSMDEVEPDGSEDESIWDFSAWNPDLIEEIIDKYADFDAYDA